MKHLFNNLPNIEKQRILEMHQSATKKNYLNEQEEFDSDFDDENEELIAPKLEDYGFSPYKEGDDINDFKQRSLDFFGSPKWTEFEKATESHSNRMKKRNKKDFGQVFDMSDEKQSEYLMNKNQEWENSRNPEDGKTVGDFLKYLRKNK